MKRVYVVGTYCSAFGKRTTDTVKDLASEAVLGALSDAGLESAERIQSCWFGNCGMWAEGQGSIRGQVCLTPLLSSGQFPERVPIINVEGGCATGSLALSGSWKDIVAGAATVSIAIGVEKTYFPDSPGKTESIFKGGIDQFDPEFWTDYYRAAGARAGKAFEPGRDRTIFMDTYAIQASYYMKTFGITQRQIALASAKNHMYAVHNPRAQYRNPMTAEEILADRPVTWPFTRSMCAPIGDGSAAAILVSEEVLRELPLRTQSRAVEVVAIGLAGGKYRSLEEPSLSHIAAQRAYEKAGISGRDIDIAEVHDATSFCELYQAEMLGFCESGKGGDFIESGASGPGGRVPINTSGGLVSKGHPVGATGLGMIAELVEQLRGEAGPRQVPGAEWALAENGGGVMGLDEAICAVTILRTSC